MAVAIACGGNGDGGGGSPEDQVRRASNEFILSFFQLFSGQKQPQAVIDLLAPECRRDINAQEIAAVIGLIRAFVPQLANARIEQVDLGNINVRQSGNQYFARPTDIGSARIRVNGQWVNMRDFFEGFGLTDDGQDDLGFEDELTFEFHNGRALVADCDAVGF